MKIGVVFPQTEIGNDPVVIRDYAQTAEALGFQHVLVYDHVLGAGTTSRPDWRGPYNSETPFHEPFVLFGFMAACTQVLELVTGVIILPQRQTALVAKQAAEVDVLSGGRLRLGVGVGWNHVEYEALNEDFHTRGARCEEQIAVLRALWTESVVTFHGRWHHMNDAGINPLPIQRPIPLWIGGESEPVLERVARVGDGWFPQSQRPLEDGTAEKIARLHTYAQDAGRAPESIGIEARLSISQVTPDRWSDYAAAWQRLGATHLSVNTMGAKLGNPRAHIEALQRVAEALGVKSQG